MCASVLLRKKSYKRESLLGLECSHPHTKYVLIFIMNFPNRLLVTHIKLRIRGYRNDNEVKHIFANGLAPFDK
jgi:hypothetical protein